jgi:hypothetical protein
MASSSSSGKQRATREFSGLDESRVLVHSDAINASRSIRKSHAIDKVLTESGYGKRRTVLTKAMKAATDPNGFIDEYNRNREVIALQAEEIYVWCVGFAESIGLDTDTGIDFGKSCAKLFIGEGFKVLDEAYNPSANAPIAVHNERDAKLMEKSVKK